MNDSSMMRKSILLIEAALINPANASFDYQGDKKGQITKVVATLKSYDSGRYTRLGRNLRRIERLEDRIKALKEQTKQESRELIAGLFNAEDAVLTRVVETVSFVFQMTKDPAETTTVKYASVLKELQEHLTPELLSIMETLVAKHSSVVQKAPALKAIDKDENTSESLSEGIGDKLRTFFQKVLDKVLSWGKSYDSRLNRLKAEVGISESHKIGEVDKERPNMFTNRTGLYQVSLTASDGKTMSASFYVKSENAALQTAEKWANGHKEHKVYGPWKADKAVGPMMGTTHGTNPEMRGEVTESEKDLQRKAFDHGLSNRREYSKVRSREERAALFQNPYQTSEERKAFKDGWDHWSEFGDTRSDGFEMRGKSIPF